MSFWEKLPKPFSVLAPMEDVTDTVFRQVMIKAGRPNVFFTEFTNVDGIGHFLKSQIPNLNDQVNLNIQNLKIYENPVLQRLVFSEIERPVVAQIWGKDPEKFRVAAKLIKDLGFDGIDINMGCPAKEVIKSGCGAALAGQNTLVAQIVEAVKEGSGELPVSVKTRLGNKKREEGWIEFLLSLDLAAITIHARIAKDMSLVPADWAEIRKIVELRNSIARARFETASPLRTLIVGNGDIKSMDDPRIAESGVDGVMIGRGVFEDPFVFKSEYRNPKFEKKERLELLKYHLELWKETWGKQKHQILNPKSQINSNNKNTKQYLKDYSIMKKYFKMYVRDWEGASELRVKLMETESPEEALTYC